MLNDTQDVSTQELQAGTTAWKTLAAAEAAWSLDRVVIIGKALLHLRAKAITAAGATLPSGPKYTAAFQQELTDSGFDGLDLKTARDFIWVSENEEETRKVDASRTTVRSVAASRHPGALRGAVEAERRKKGKQKANAAKKLPAVFLRQRLRDLPKEDRIDHICQLAGILKNLCGEHLPDAYQDADLALLHLGIVRTKAKQALKPPAAKEPGVPLPFTCRSVEYRSDADAAIALGLTVDGVRTARKKGQTAVDKLGLRGAVPITIRGVNYGSIKEAAEALGVSEQTISEARLRDRLDDVGMTRKLAVVGGKEVHLHSVPVTGHPEGSKSGTATVTLSMMPGE